MFVAHQRGEAISRNDWLVDKTWVRGAITLGGRQSNLARTTPSLPQAQLPHTWITAALGSREEEAG